MLTNEQAIALLNAQLSKTDPEVIKPLAKYTFTRDLPEGDPLGRLVDSMVLTRITRGVGQGTGGMDDRSWIANGANDLKGVDIDMDASAVRVYTAGREATYTQMELDRAAAYGIQLDTERIAVINDIFQQEAQAVGYLGDTRYGIKGLLNHDAPEKITGSGLLSGSTKEVKKLIEAFDSAMRQAEEASGDIVVPTRLLVCPADYVKLHSIKIDDGYSNTVSLVEYLEKHSYAAKSMGDFKVEKVRELKGLGGDAQKNRMVLYTPDKQYLRYAVLPMWREKTYDKGLQYCAAYLWRIAELQLRHPETITYIDNI